MARNKYAQYNTRNRSLQRKTPISRKQRRHSPHRLLLLIVLFVLLAAAIIVLINWSPWSSKKNDSEASSSLGSDIQSTSASSGLSSGGSSASPESSQENLNDLTPAAERDITGLSVETFNTMMIVGNSGYRYFEFSEQNSISYIDMIAEAAQSMSGKATIYSLICPTATDIMLPQSFLADKDTSDQQKALDYLTASINAVEPSIKTVPLFDILKAHCDEDLYFQTDRNWTALGAYYAYTRFAAEKGITPIRLSDCAKYDYTGFRGSLYSQSNEHSALEDTETLTAYLPPYNALVKITDASGETFDSGLIVDVSDYDTNMKYCAFLGGDYPYILVQNSDITDGSSCIVIEETMGSAMVPFLAAHYQNVHVIDYRYWNGNLKAFAEENGVTDILFINSIEHTNDYDANSSLKGLLS